MLTSLKRVHFLRTQPGANGGLSGLSAAFLLTVAALSMNANAHQPFPNRTLRLVVHSLPGGGTAISARLIAPKMSEQLGQQVVVENRAGAASMIGSELVARAAPDGYTLQDSVDRERLRSDGAEPVGNTPDGFAAVIRNDLAKWATVIKVAGVTGE